MAANIDQNEPKADLAYINKHHSFPLELNQKPESPNRFLAAIRRAVRSFLLGSYFEEEQRYLAHLVRTINDLARLRDAQTGPIEARLSEALRNAAEPLRDRIDRLEAGMATMKSRLEVLDPVVKGLERIVAVESSGVAATLKAAADTEAEQRQSGNGAELFKSGIDYRYLLLENRYRGSEEEIARRLEPYGELFRLNGQTKAPVLEIGAGRGELQQIFKRIGVPSYGIELDDAMVVRCAEQALDVRLEDGIAHLKSLPDHSLGGVIAIQVIEHLDVPTLNQLFALCAKKICRGGLAVVETIHTPSLLALCHNYFRDPTHKQPLHPDTTQYMMELSGLLVREIRLLSPYPRGAELQEVAIPDELTPQFRGSLETVNSNIRELNRLIFGHQDYAVIAQVP